MTCQLMNAAINSAPIEDAPPSRDLEEVKQSASAGNLHENRADAYDVMLVTTKFLRIMEYYPRDERVSPVIGAMTRVLAKGQGGAAINIVQASEELLQVLRIEEDDTLLEDLSPQRKLRMLQDHFQMTGNKEIKNIEEEEKRA